MGGGAWPFLVGGVICRVNSITNEMLTCEIARPALAGRQLLRGTNGRLAEKGTLLPHLLWGLRLGFGIA
jgi:hypothetical protein